MTVEGHAVIKIYGKTELTPKNLINGAIDYAKLNKKDEYGNKSFYSAIIEESHVIAHKFEKYWILDIYTCGNKNQLENTLEYMVSNFEINEIYGFYTPRGRGFDGDDFEGEVSVNFNPLNHGYDHVMLDLETPGHNIKTVDQVVDAVKKIFDGDVIARYQFSPYGGSGIIKQGRKLVTFHTWPEYDLHTIDFIGFRSHEDIPKILEFVKTTRSKVLREINLAYGKSQFRY